MLSFVYIFAFEKMLLNIECLRYDSFHQLCDLKLFSLSLSIDCLNFFDFLFAVLGSNMPLHTVGKHSFPKPPSLQPPFISFFGRAEVLNFGGPIHKLFFNGLCFLCLFGVLSS